MFAAIPRKFAASSQPDATSGMPGKYSQIHAVETVTRTRARNMYTIDVQGAWHCHLSSEIPACWRILGVIRSEADGSRGRSPTCRLVRMCRLTEQTPDTSIKLRLPRQSQRAGFR